MSSRNYYNRDNKCDECKNQLNRLHREYDKKGNWSGRWLCNKCSRYSNKYGTTDPDTIKKIKNKFYNATNTCDRCGADFDKTNSPGRHYKEYINEKWTGQWLCHKCYSKDDKKRPDHILNLIKAINKYTTKNYRYNLTDTCDRCGIKLVAGTYPRREYDKNGNWTGRWDCYKCYSKYDPFSKINLLKSVGDRETHNQNPNSPNAKGDKFQKLTCLWLGVKDLNIENNNFHSSIDHSRHDILGFLQTKGKLYDPYNKRWDLNAKSEQTKNFDNLIFYCLNEDGKHIDRLYIFPWHELMRRTTISIYLNSVRKYSPWTEDYRIKDTKIIKLVNDIWNTIKD